MPEKLLSMSLIYISTLKIQQEKKGKRKRGRDGEKIHIQPQSTHLVQTICKSIQLSADLVQGPSLGHYDFLGKFPSESVKSRLL